MKQKEYDQQVIEGIKTMQAYEKSPKAGSGGAVRGILNRIAAGFNLKRGGGQ